MGGRCVYLRGAEGVSPEPSTTPPPSGESDTLFSLKAWQHTVCGRGRGREKRVKLDKPQGDFGQKKNIGKGLWCNRSLKAIPG